MKLVPKNTNNSNNTDADELPPPPPVVIKVKIKSRSLWLEVNRGIYKDSMNQISILTNENTEYTVLEKNGIIKFIFSEEFLPRITAYLKGKPKLNISH